MKPGWRDVMSMLGCSWIKLRTVRSESALETKYTLMGDVSGLSASSRFRRLHAVVAPARSET